jgi:hypothetical protein
MSFPITFPISPVGSAADQDFGLRVFQRVNAQVLSVTGTSAILEVEGHPFVAQLTSADQAAELASRQTAQFIVTELSNQSVTLKLVKSETLVAGASNAADLAGEILEANNLPQTSESLTLARALLKQHLPVTPRLLSELIDALAEHAAGPWRQAEADLAAAMKAAGLPVTAQSLTLAARTAAPTAEALSRLIAALTQALSQNPPPELRRQINVGLQALNSLAANWAGKSPQMADQLKAAAGMLGRSIENILLEQNQAGEKSISKNSLVLLAQLQTALQEAGQKESAQAVGEFLSDVRREQLMNVKPDPIPGQGQWSEMGFVLRDGEKIFSARLKVAHETHAGSSKINPAYTRLILQVDLQADETVEVDLSLVGRQIRAAIMAEDATWRKVAHEELPSLEAALGGLGYQLDEAQIGAGKPKPFEKIQIPAGDVSLLTVNIEV